MTQLRDTRFVVLADSYLVLTDPHQADTWKVCAVDFPICANGPDAPVAEDRFVEEVLMYFKKQISVQGMTSVLEHLAVVGKRKQPSDANFGVKVSISPDGKVAPKA